MTTKIKSLPLAVVIKLAQAELMESYRTHNVYIFTVGLLDRDEIDDADNEQSIIVLATMNSDEECFAEDCGTHPWLLKWDEDECSFSSLCRWDQDEDSDDDYSKE